LSFSAPRAPHTQATVVAAILCARARARASSSTRPLIRPCGRVEIKSDVEAASGVRSKTRGKSSSKDKKDSRESKSKSKEEKKSKSSKSKSSKSKSGR
jgi:hypothetical protein